MKLFNSILTFYLFCVLSFLNGCNNSEIVSLREENKNLKINIRNLESKNDSLKIEIEKLINPPHKLYSKGLNLERSGDFKDAKIEYEKILEWYPKSSQTYKAKSRIKNIENIFEKNRRVKDLAYNLKSKFEGSSRAELLSLKIINNDLVVEVGHSDCDYFDSIFVDVGVGCYRYGKMDQLKFGKIILKFHCQNKIKRYYMFRSELMRYVRLSINDPQFISLIKRF